ncbi:hypothetical protein ES332_D12G279500v1 [Gossypium tomentosum]|uniref:Uncharacterized protein n=1 Tax=Gossypium tomentosum TaxID=34277 RepID=A0A5D2IEW8_GOSTO|nr:hypothetical protein ES332_D12G279500v1 [Gossypium tomentosum]
MKPTRESMVTNRRQLTPAQRSAKIERDRRRRRERNMEFERLQKAETELQALTAAQRNENSCLRHHNERLNDMVSILENIIHQLREQNRELQQKNLGLEQTMKLTHGFRLINVKAPMKKFLTISLVLKVQGVLKAVFHMPRGFPIY